MAKDCGIVKGLLGVALAMRYFVFHINASTCKMKKKKI